MPDGYDRRDDVISAYGGKPTNLALKRSGETMELTWAIPLYLRSSDYHGRTITFCDAAWSFNASKNMEKRWKEVREGYGHTIADRLWIRDLGTSASSHSQDFDRDLYHPMTEGRYLTSIDAWVMINDTTGRTDVVDAALYSEASTKVTYTFGKPAAPVLGDPTYDAQDHTVSCRFDCLDDELVDQTQYSERERYSVWMYVERKDNVDILYKERQRIDEEIYTSDSDTFETAAIEGAASLAYDQWIDIHFWVRARGIAGDSPWEHKCFTIAHPPKATVQGVTADTGKGLVTVRLRTNANAYHPCDTVELERLADTTVWTAAAAKQASGWTSAGSSADAYCTGLTDQLSAAQPSRDHYTFYRVKTTRCGYVQYSEPFRAKELEKLGSPVDDDYVAIHSVTAQDDGTSLKVVLAWTWQHDDSNGTEVSWSKYADAWQSTSPPSTYDLDDSRRDATSQVPGKVTATLVIRDLEEGTPYYIKARRYQDNGGDRVYASYYTPADAYYPIAPKSESTGVHLSGPQYARRGEGCTLTWTFDSVSEQKSWNLYRVWDTTSNNTTTEHRLLVASGDDQSGSAVLNPYQMGGSDSASFVVAITTGGEWSESDRATVTLADAPEIVIGVVTTLDEQPMSFGFSCDRPADVVAKVTSCGTSSGTPDGELAQVPGDVIWSARFTPAWEVGQSGEYNADAVLPDGLPFVDGTRYMVEVTAIDTETGFSSPTDGTTFAVDWDHKASPPATTSTVTPDVANLAVRIHPVAPTGAVQTDVYDLYRVSNDSTDLIAEGQPFGIDAVDRYAPYSKDLGLVYRIATRTSDGDVQWADFVYDMKVGVLSFDWDEDKHLELPYDIALQDSYEKNYESHKHMDGSVSGHWNPGYGKQGTYSTDIIKIRDAEQVKRVREMATYPGPVFVRTPDGGAFEANVTLGVDTAYSSGAIGVSLNVQAHTLSNAFRLGIGDFIDTTATGA